MMTMTIMSGLFFEQAQILKQHFAPLEEAALENPSGVGYGPWA